MTINDHTRTISEADLQAKALSIGLWVVSDISNMASRVGSTDICVCLYPDKDANEPVCLPSKIEWIVSGASPFRSPRYNTFSEAELRNATDALNLIVVSDISHPKSRVNSSDFVVIQKTETGAFVYKTTNAKKIKRGYSPFTNQTLSESELQHMAGLMGLRVVSDISKEAQRVKRCDVDVANLSDIHNPSIVILTTKVSAIAAQENPFVKQTKTEEQLRSRAAAMGLIITSNISEISMRRKYCDIFVNKKNNGSTSKRTTVGGIVSYQNPFRAGGYDGSVGGNLYIRDSSHEKNSRFKLGITNTTSDNRASYYGYDSTNVFEVKFEDGTIPPMIEYQIKKILQGQSFEFLDHEQFDGYTETYPFKFWESPAIATVLLDHLKTHKHEVIFDINNISGTVSTEPPVQRKPLGMQ